MTEDELIIKDRAEATARVEALQRSLDEARRQFAELSPREQAELSARVLKASGHA